jgi:hypothetical protein
MRQENPTPRRQDAKERKAGFGLSLRFLATFALLR